MKRPTIAICYDFDGTLASGNMQEYGFFNGLDKQARRTFWNESNTQAKECGAEQELM